MPQILVVEDESHLATGLKFNLEAEGYQVILVDTGEDALRQVVACSSSLDVILLDVMLPGIDGFAVASELRGTGCFLPILMLTARNRPEDVLKGFEAGADDYLPKPFELPILLARLRGLLRRQQWHRAPVVAPPPADQYSFAGKTIDFNTLLIQTGAESIQLTLMEANLLRYLIQHAGQTVSRRQILEEVWNVHENTDTRAIDNFIVRLRRYLEPDPATPKHLLTVRGVGYRFLPTP